MAKKTTKKEVTIEAVEKPVKVETPKKEVKEWTYDELAILPRDQYLKVEADIKAGRATVKQE